MTIEQQALALVNEVRKLGHFRSNALDVIIEVALFTPSDAYVSVRPNSAGSKVIYTDAAGMDHTFWARDWTADDRRAKTLSALEALAKHGLAIRKEA